MNTSLILGELEFDSSLSENFDKSVNKEEYKEKIISLLIPILKNRFKNDFVKQRIDLHHDRITFSCPYCGDSLESSYKKRGNIILQGKYRNFFKCHNCGTFKRVDHFFSDYKVSLNLDIINYISNDIGNDLNYKYDISLLLDKDSIEKYAIERENLKEKFNLIEVNGNIINKWLRNRLQYNTANFLYNPLKNYILILNLTPSGKIIGAQKRLFTGFNKYLTFKLSKLYEIMGNIIKVPDDIDVISQMFGIFNISFNKSITVFEGAFDSFLFKNSIAMSGANKNFPLELSVRFWFDDDKTGIKKTIEYLEENIEVFLWDKFKKDLGLPYRKKWDLTDVLIYLKNNNLNIPDFNNYFSNSPLDIIDI
jgi:predicted RNA-binding Zn-ribbon protein involved in translation (DUF1610 family)